MPYTPPATLKNVDGRQRKLLTGLVQERAFLQCSLSLTQLREFMSDDEIRSCVVATDDNSLKEVKAPLNDRISAIMTENNITTLQAEDAFGSPKNFIYMETRTPARFDKEKARLSMLAHKVNPTVVAKVLEEATVPGIPYTTLQVRSVKEKGEGGDGK